MTKTWLELTVNDTELSGKLKAVVDARVALSDAVYALQKEADDSFRVVLMSAAEK